MLFLTHHRSGINIPPKAHLLFLPYCFFMFFSHTPFYAAIRKCRATQAYGLPCIYYYHNNHTRAFCGTRIRTRTRPGNIYPGKTRTRFCYPCLGAPARDHGAGCITPLGKSGCSSKCTKKSDCTLRRAYQTLEFFGMPTVPGVSFS